MNHWKARPAHGGTPSYATFTVPLERSEQDVDREYRLIRLENGLQAVLVHDPSADKAAACLHVTVGHLQDPPDMPGLAHFCEHMLFKGSRQFPLENDFLSFITSNGGFRNASTGPTDTDYWFSVGSDLLKGALARLAAFLHSPLFAPSVTAREINAVDSENKRNLQNDQRRIFQLNKSLSVPGHPWTKFGTGNIESLTATAKQLESQGRLHTHADDADGDGGPVGRETRRRLIEWWEHEYCARRMTLAVLGKESLEELADLTAKLFSHIPDRALKQHTEINEPPWGRTEMGTVVFVKTVKDFYSFSLTFLLPYQRPHFRSKPTRFISHLLGHEGPGSIYSFLKNQGWIVSLSAGPQTWNRGVQTFQISGKLTRAGFTRYRDVLLALYNYLSLLRSSSLPAFHHEEVRKLSEISFRFKEKTQPHTYATYLAEELAEEYPPEWLLSGSTLVREWDEGLVRKIIENFVPESGRVMLMAKEHPTAPAQAEWETEKWYGTQYRIERLEQGLIDKAKEPNANPDLFLPRPNSFIPTNFDVGRVESPEPSKQPRCIRETPTSILWHKRDDQFHVPKAHIKLDIRSPIAYATPQYAVLTELLAELVEDALAEVTYDAQLAGLNYAVKAHDEGLLVSLGGYSDKLSILIRTVISKIKNLDIDSRRLAVITEQTRLQYENFYLAQPSVLSDYMTSYLLTPVIWTPAEKLAELLVLTEKDIRRHKEELLSSACIESLVNGNFETQQAIDIMNIVEDILTPGPLARFERLSKRSLILPEGSCNLVKEGTVADPKEQNSSLTYYCHFGDVIDQKLRPALDLISHIIREPCFSQLRTTEQLGYIISSSRWSAAGSMGLCVQVQSLQDPAFLEGRVEAFLETFHRKLESFSKEEFEVQKEGLIVKKLERLKNLREESSRFWHHISSGYYDFTRQERDAATIRDLTLMEILNAYAVFMSPKSPSRRKMSVHMRSQDLGSPVSSEGAVLIKNDSIFKASLMSSLSPSPVDASRGPDSDIRTRKARL